MLDEAQSATLAALLAWYRDMGVDTAIGDVPVDWLALRDQPPGAAFMPASASQPSAIRPAEPSAGARQAPRPPQPAAPAPTRQFPVAAPDAAAMSARGLAQKAETLAALEASLSAFDGCTLKATAKSLCFYRGAARARIMCIGEAPGRDEDLQGKPFVGRAGQLLDKMLASIGLSEETVHITNIVYWRPPGNRTPTPQEAQVCRPFLERQVELVGPDILVLLGGAAAKHIFDVPDGIMRIRGKLRDVSIGNRQMRALATLHPAYLLRTPPAKRLAWRDLLAIKSALAQT